MKEYLVVLKKTYQIIISLCLLLLILLSQGCSKSPWALPEDFIGVTKVQVIDYLPNEQHQFRFFVFTSIDNPLRDAFKNEYIDKLSVKSLPPVYLSNQGEHSLALLYEIEVTVKTIVCTFSELKIAFDDGVKMINFGYYEMKEGKKNPSQIDVSLLYDLKANDNIFQILIHNYRLTDLLLDQVIFLEKGAKEQMVLSQLTDNIIASDQIKLISNLKLDIPEDLFYIQGLITLTFKNEYQSFDYTALYLFDYLPDYYELQKQPIDINKLSIQK